MPRLRGRESRAVTLAGALARQHGPHALGRVLQWRSDAEAAGDHRRADLYRAVSIVIADRGGVFSRSRTASGRR